MENNIRREDWKTLKPTIYGWGINDVNYRVNIKKQSKLVWSCPYYEDWCKIIQRCFSKKFQESCPSYIGTEVFEDWRYLSNFIEWVDSQPNRNWENCSPDKDFLSGDIRTYSPQTVVYISAKLNCFITDSKRARGSLMLGVRLAKSKKNPYQATCNNPFSGVKEYLGVFPTELEAHLAWQAKKHEHACTFASEQDDPRIINILLNMYTPDKDFTTT